MPCPVGSVSSLGTTSSTCRGSPCAKATGAIGERGGVRGGRGEQQPRSLRVGDVGRGLVERTDGPPRGLRVSTEGTRVLADASAQQLRALEDRVAGWLAADLRAFAAMLELFNAGG